MNYVHPLFLKAHSAARKLDNPSWKEATRGKFADEYWKAMELEIATLEALGAWEVLEYDSKTMPNVIQSTWAFKCKHLVLVVSTLMIMVPRVLSQMRELKDLTLLLMVKVIIGPHEDVIPLRG